MVNSRRSKDGINASCEVPESVNAQENQRLTLQNLNQFLITQTGVL